MKLKKIAMAALFALIAALAFAFAACGDGTPAENGGNGSDLDPSITETETPSKYTMQAEYIDLDGVKGSGLSNSAEGVAMITGNGTDAEKEKGWGEGYYVSQMHAAGCRLDFVFTARSAQTTSISVRLSSELGQLTFTPQDLAFMLNDKELPYTTLVVKGAQTSTPDLTAAVFNDYTITTSVMLEKGENTFSIMVRQNSLRGDGNVAGPMVDSVTFTTKAVLEWTDHKDNISRRDNSESDM